MLQAAKTPSELALSLYDAALGAVDWSRALEDLRTSFHATEVHLLVYDERALTVHAQCCAREPELVRYWYERWGLQGNCPRLAHSFTNPNSLAWDYQFIDEKAIARSDYYNDLNRVGIDYYLGLRVRDVQRSMGGLTYGMAITFGKSAGHVQSPCIELARALEQHMQRAFAIAMERATAASFADLAEAVGVVSGRGLICVGSDATVLRCNQVADALLAGGNSLRSERGRLTAKCHADTRRLHKLVASAAHGVNGTSPVGGSMSLNDDRGLPHLSITVAPLPLRGAVSDVSPRPRGALVFITPLQRNQTPDPEVLEQLHRLSPAEARVAAKFLAGLSVPEIAEALGITTRTVRFHFQNLFAKLGVEGQTGLMAMLGRSVIH